MAIDFKMTSEEKKQVAQFTNAKTGPGKLVNPSEKIGEKIPVHFPTRGR